MSRSHARILTRVLGLRGALLPLLAVLSFVFVTFIGACGDPPSLSDAASTVHAEPARLVFHPETDAIAVSVVNDGTEPVAIGGFRIEGPDWASFSLVEPLNTTTVEPGKSVSFHVDIDEKSLLGPDPSLEKEPIDLFADPDEEEDEDAIRPDEYRTGAATLRFTANGSEHAVPMQFEDPSWVWQYLVPALIKIHLLVLAFIMPLASLLTWMERKQSAMMQDRVGPNMARVQLGGVTLRLWGLLHIATDGLKMLFKEDFIPRRAHRQLYSLAPMMAFVPAMVVFAIVPFGDAICYGQLGEVLHQPDLDQCAAGRGGTPLQIARIDVGLLYYFAIASLASYGTTLAGWASYNKWAVLGSLRSSAQMISYEVAIGLTLVGALLVYGTLEPHALVHAQLDGYWGILLQPIAFVLFFTAAIAETKRAPFDLPEGESEIIGYFLEYSGMRFGLFFLGEFIEVVFVGALVTTLFLGGWALPFDMMGAAGFASPWMAQAFFGGAGAVLLLTGAAIWRASKHAEGLGMVLALLGSLHLAIAIWSMVTGWGTELPHIAVVVVGMVTWGIKVLALCWLQLLIRWTLPRFRYDQLMSLGWKGLLPLSIANIVLTAIVVYAMTGTAPPGTTPAPAGARAVGSTGTAPAGAVPPPSPAPAGPPTGAAAPTAPAPSPQENGQ